jgi:hypothetical protein
MSQEELREAFEEGAQEEAPVVESPQLEGIEQEAYKEGWRPETEFEGDKSKWIAGSEERSESSHRTPQKGERNRI